MPFSVSRSRNAVTVPSRSPSIGSRFTTRSYSATQSFVKIFLILAASIPRLIHGRPTAHPELGRHSRFRHEHSHKNIGLNWDYFANVAEQSSFWLYGGIAFALVITGGIFAGLTLGLMGQDEIYLQVIEQSGEGAERIHARRVLRLLKKGKHWVLVTLLLSNVITNETLPIVLDRSLGGGWPAVVTSTFLIVIFGEIIPQSVCVRYGLAIGSYLSPFVLGLMYVMYPIAYPTALLLDWILGEDHGTVYKKAGLKTLVTLHKTLGPSPSERLNQDEVTIISAVLDLKDKPVGAIMTPIEDVFTMSSDDVLDEDTMNRILSAGYSRIPIHAPGEPTNFVGMLLVKILITYDPEDGLKVKDFPLATLPETAPDTSCLDIVNFFQEGKSHMVLVSAHPGENYGALGVVTLEDVIEELIGEEIIDESDVFIDVHKAIRRINPSPLARRSISSHPARVADAIAAAAVVSSIGSIDANHMQGTFPENEDGIVNRKNSNPHPIGPQNIPPSVMQHLKHLGPSNLASNPKKTGSKTIKIKQGNHDDQTKGNSISGRPLTRSSSNASETQNPFTSGGVPGQHAGNSGSRPGSRYGAISGDNAIDPHAQLISLDETQTSYSNSPRNRATASYNNSSRAGVDPQKEQNQLPAIKKVARSGSLVESVKTSGGVPKTVIETTSSEDDDENEQNGGRVSSSEIDKKGSGNTKGRESETGKGKKETSPLLRAWGMK